MKAAFICIAIVAAGISLWLILRKHVQPPKANTQQDIPATNVFADLRAKYFILKRTDISIPDPTSATEPWVSL